MIIMPKVAKVVANRFYECYWWGCEYSLGIAIGAFDDRNTTDHNDDVMASFSSYIDPSSNHGDREKPEVTAPGVNIMVDSIFGNVSGTSFSAPHVAGGAALLMERNSTFKYWPEAVKAILMATAIHNIEGSSRLSEYDGAGGINLDYADQVANNINNWRFGTIYPGNSIDYYFTASAGQRVRAVITWDATPSYTYYNDQPGVDLDMHVYKPSGGFITGSYSW